MVNSIIAGNTSGSGADLENRGTLKRVGANFFQSVLAPGCSSADASQRLAVACGTQGLRRAEPNHATRPDSPAIDAGIVTTFTTDQRGCARVIGAVEGVFNSSVALANATHLTSDTNPGPSILGPSSLASAT